MYCPIVGSSSENTGQESAATPDATMTRTVRLKEEYEQLENDLREELNMVDDRMIKPAMKAKDFLQPLKKVIKKRDDKKVCTLLLRLPLRLYKPGWLSVWKAFLMPFQRHVST